MPEPSDVKPHRIAVRAVNNDRINPPVVPPTINMTDEVEAFGRLMVFGLEGDETIDGEHVKAGWPLTYRQAARYLGMRLKRARDICDAPQFVAHQNKLLAQARNAERPRNLAVAVTIRDDEGQGLAADKTVRLKAIATIEGTEGKAGVNVSVNVNSGNRTTIVPGYAIRLPADMPMPARHGVVIDGTLNPPQEEQGQ